MTAGHGYLEKETYRPFTGQRYGRGRIIYGMVREHLTGFITRKGATKVTTFTQILLVVLAFYLLIFLIVALNVGLNLFSARTFFEFTVGTTPGFVTLRNIALIAAAIIGSRLISDDIHNRSLTMYMARPIKRVDYILAKFIVISVVLMVFTVLVSVFQYCISLLVWGHGWVFFFTHLNILAAIVISTLMITAIFGSLVLMFSSIIRRWGNTALAFFLVVFIPNGLANLFAADRPYAILISIQANLANVGGQLFGLEPQYEVPWYLSLAVLVGLFIFNLGVVYWRILKTELQ